MRHDSQLAWHYVIPWDYRAHSDVVSAKIRHTNRVLEYVIVTVLTVYLHVPVFPG